MKATDTSAGTQDTAPKNTTPALSCNRCVSVGMLSNIYKKLSIVAILCVSAFSAPPSELPGEELTERQIYDAKMKTERSASDVAASGATLNSGATRSWLEKAMDTWNAPHLAEQMNSDDIIIPFGKGGVFVPKYTESNTEPEVEVFDLNDNRVGASEPGRTIVLDPGEYKVMLGSGAFRQRIEKQVRVNEGHTQPIIPDWSGLIVDVVDEQGIVMKGEYELVRIDEFDPYGRGYGASIELGETVRAWILKPGVYKILGVGEGYNTLTNFVTVRLMPGELTNFMLIQDEDDFRIRGGGTIHISPTTKLISNWYIGANVGANLQLNMETDHQNDIASNAFTTGLMFDAWLLYRKKPVEWNTRLRLDESVNIVDNSIAEMINNPDRLLLSSIFIWRIFSWFGPYARAEFNTKFFDNKIRRGGSDGLFCFVDENYVLDEARGMDTAGIFVIEPAFSPTVFELGAGVNADLTTRRYIEARARLGFGSAYSRYGDRYRIIESDKVIYASADSLEQSALLSKNSTVILYPESKINIVEIGPQTSLNVVVRIGAYASAEGEVKLFAPILPEQRLNKPDFEINGTLSWRLSSVLNLDYTYRQTLKRPAELDAPVHTSTHGIWLRLHYSSR